MDQVNFFQNFVCSFGLNLSNPHHTAAANYAYPPQYYPNIERNNLCLSTNRMNNNMIYSDTSYSPYSPELNSPNPSNYQSELLRSHEMMMIARPSVVKSEVPPPPPPPISPDGMKSASFMSDMSVPPVHIENKRVRNMFSEKQIEILERAFEQTHYPDLGMREELSRVLNLKPLRIQVWFQNRRAKYRKFDYCSKPTQKQTSQQLTKTNSLN